MAGLPCAKVIIDNGNRLTSVLQCMNASIILNADKIQPTVEMENEFVRLAEELAQYSAKIERYVGVDTTVARADTEGKKTKKDQ